MSTYAVYRIWAGVRLEDLRNGVVKDGMKVGALLFTYIYMHGEKVGYGMELDELGWEPCIVDANLYDPSIGDRMKFALKKIKEAFKKAGITVEPKLYHHIDLGG